MGGPHATGDLRLGHVTQVWLATSDDADALVSGGYWHHQRRVQADPRCLDEAWQARLMGALERHTGIHLAG